MTIYTLGLLKESGKEQTVRWDMISYHMQLFLYSQPLWMYEKTVGRDALLKSGKFWWRRVVNN